jgi:hypothetical protein
MIIDVEDAFINYFTTNMVSLVGHGNGTVGLYRTKFPDDGWNEGVAFHAELRESHGSVYEIEKIALRVKVRTTDKQHTFILMQNADDLLDRYVHKNLDSNVEMCLAKRNSGPDFFPGENDGFQYGIALYSITVRWRGNDA